MISYKVRAMLDDELIETKISTEDIFKGSLLWLKKDTVELSNKKIATREWIKHPGAAAVLPIFDNNDIVLVKQYRYPIGRITLEIPAGKLENVHETPLDCAVRELSEETGYGAECFEKLTTVATTVGFSNEYIHIYVARQLVLGKAHTDEDEFVNVVRMPLQEVVKMVHVGEIMDSKTIIAILMTAHKYNIRC